MNVKITPMFPIKLIGFESEFNFDNSYQEIPKFWDEICAKHCTRIYAGGEVPKGMKLIELEKGDWAVFDCYGPNPKTLQETNTRIFNEWIPNNNEYEVRANYNIEWYD